jgi:hypothetical protein
VKAFEGREARELDKPLARKIERLEKSRAEWRAKFYDVIDELDVLRAQIAGDDDPWETHCRKILGRVWGERHKQEAAYGHVNGKLKWGTGPDAEWLHPFVGPEGDFKAAQIQEMFRSAYERYEEEQGLPTWRHLVLEEVAEAFQEDDPERRAEELIQVAALCVSWVERITKES